MEVSKKPWSVASLCGFQSRIDTNPDYQRPAVWELSQKQLLIDTILRGYDVPKFYWRRTQKSPERYEVVDGQQRTRALWEFHVGKFALPKDAEPIEGEKVAGMKYEQLPEDLRLRFDNYGLDIVVVSDTDEEEVREMFLRLQNGTTLKAQEKRNAMPGKMRDFVRSLAAHVFFSNCGFSNSRFNFDLVAAQMVLIELSGGPTNVKSGDLNRMYKDERDFDDNGAKARKVRRVLDFLAKAFPEKTPELERYSVISLYMLTSQLLEGYVFQDRHADLSTWFIEFETLRRAESEKPVDQCDPEVVTYHEKTSHSTDSKDSLQSRHDYLFRKLLERFPDVELKDNQRLFSHPQRLAIFRRDSGVCQIKLKCAGVKCDWDAWEADHIKAWSKGGRTTVSNGQVGCVRCNQAKSAGG